MKQIKNEPSGEKVFKQSPSGTGVFGGDTPRTPRKKTEAMTKGRFNQTRFAKVMNYESFLLLNDRVQKRQTLPDHCKVPTTGYFTSKGANLLTALSIYWLKSEGIFASRQNSTGVPMKQRDGSIKWKPTMGMKGAGDIYAIVAGGRSLWIEIKFGRDKQSEDQMKFEDQVTKMGAIYWIVRTFDDLLAKLDERESKTFKFSATQIAQKSTISHLLHTPPPQPLKPKYGLFYKHQIFKPKTKYHEQK